MKTARSKAILGTIFCLIAAISLLSATPVSAALVVESFVSRRPVNMSDLSLAEFVDNLTDAQSRYIQDEPIIFKITVGNTASQPVANLKIEDDVPAYLTAHGVGLFGWDPQARIVRIDAGELFPNQTRDFLIPMKFVNADQIPDNLGVLCQTNRVRVATGVETAQDTSQFCMQERFGEELGKSPQTTPTATPKPTATVTPIKSPTPTVTPTAGPSTTPAPTKAPTNVVVVPQTGPSGGILLAALELFTLGTGIALKRKFS